VATAPAASQGEVVPVNEDAPKALSPAIVEAYTAMIENVPEAGGDGMASILTALLQVEHPDDLDAPWRSGGLEEFINVPLLIQGIRKAPSDYQGGLPFFLIADAVVIATGELVTITTGAVSVVAQLAKAHALGAFPWRVIPRQSDRPSERGYYPQHLEVVPSSPAS
jgi:hypothetical protein